MAERAKYAVATAAASRGGFSRACCAFDTRVTVVVGARSLAGSDASSIVAGCSSSVVVVLVTTSVVVHARPVLRGPRAVVLPENGLGRAGYPLR